MTAQALSGDIRIRAGHFGKARLRLDELIEKNPELFSHEVVFFGFKRSIACHAQSTFIVAFIFSVSLSGRASAVSLSRTAAFPAAVGHSHLRSDFLSPAARWHARAPRRRRSRTAGSRSRSGFQALPHNRRRAAWLPVHGAPAALHTRTASRSPHPPSMRAGHARTGRASPRRDARRPSPAASRFRTRRGGNRTCA